MERVYEGRLLNSSVRGQGRDLTIQTCILARFTRLRASIPEVNQSTPLDMINGGSRFFEVQKALLMIIAGIREPDEAQEDQGGGDGSSGDKEYCRWICSDCPHVDESIYRRTEDLGTNEVQVLQDATLKPCQIKQPTLKPEQHREPQTSSQSPFHPALYTMQA